MLNIRNPTSTHHRERNCVEEEQIIRNTTKNFHKQNFQNNPTEQNLFFSIEYSPEKLPPQDHS